MGQSLSQIYVHLTFSTKDRTPYIKEEWEFKLYACISDIFKSYNSQILIINSLADHIHILFSLPKDKTLTALIDVLKKESTKWIHAMGDEYKNFAWQDGYGAFSVSHSQLDIVSRSIKNQKKEHHHKSYKEEVDEIMEQLGIVEYDSVYFWN